MFDLSSLNPRSNSASSTATRLLTGPISLASNGPLTFCSHARPHGDWERYRHSPQRSGRCRQILLDEDRQFTESAKTSAKTYVTPLHADLLTIRPGASHFSGHDDLYLAGRCLDRREGNAGADAAREALDHDGDLHASPDGAETGSAGKVVDVLFSRQRLEVVA